MNQDIDFILQDWEYKPGMVQARLVQTRNGRQVIQMRRGPGGAADRDRRPARWDQAAWLPHLLQLLAGTDAHRPEDGPDVPAQRGAVSGGRSGVRAVLSSPHLLAGAAAICPRPGGFRSYAWLHGLHRQACASDDYRQAHDQYRGFVLFQPPRPPPRSRSRRRTRKAPSTRFATAWS